mmetsp:Transcript_156042/g.500428  ORF Transcript_156042/g.500428 Transcript_156042/m.500428 type:complete len:215 (-) Transcript_156042:194-838(-)
MKNVQAELPPAARQASARPRHEVAPPGNNAESNPEPLSPDALAAHGSVLCTRTQSRRPAGSEANVWRLKDVSETAVLKSGNLTMELPEPVELSKSTSVTSLAFEGSSTVQGSRQDSCRGASSGAKSRSRGSSTLDDPERDLAHRKLPVEVTQPPSSACKAAAAAPMVSSQRCCSACVAQLSSSPPTEMQKGRPGSPSATALPCRGMLPRRISWL